MIMYKMLYMKTFDLYKSCPSMFRLCHRSFFNGSMIPHRFFSFSVIVADNNFCGFWDMHIEHSNGLLIMPSAICCALALTFGDWETLLFIFFRASFLFWTPWIRLCLCPSQHLYRKYPMDPGNTLRRSFPR